MCTEKLQEINNILDSKPSRMRESYFINNYSDIYDKIREYTKDIDVPFVQRIWHYVNDHPNYFRCQCGNLTSFHRNWINGYREYCSAKCTQSNPETKLKRKDTVIRKYGVDNIAKSEVSKKKTEDTNIERYGCKSSFQNIEVRNKWKKKIQEKYGVDHYFQTKEFKIKAKSYYLKKYGVEYPLQVEEIMNKIINTNMERYGVSTYLNTEHSRSCIKEYSVSQMEIEISNWLKDLGENVETSNWKIINPLSIDIYLPYHNLAIEFNGLYWHSELHKEKNYHLNKTNKCRELGIDLIHIWEDDWLNRKDILRSVIMNKINRGNDKIYARKCIIKEVNNSDTSKFLNDNHIQGYNRFSKSIGLYHKDELVSIMTFGNRNTNAKSEFELIRFCNKKFTNVIGSASKLFKYFLNNYKCDLVTSYADISLFNGGVYKSLGFDFIHRSPPNYWWIVNGVRKHRFTYNKKKLVKMGHDAFKTEVEIMNEMGHYRIFGCGQDKWVYTK